VRVSYAPGLGDEHQQEASRKAAELALSRRRRQSGAPDPPLASLSSSLNAQSGMRSSMSGRGDTLSALMPPGTPAETPAKSPTKNAHGASPGGLAAVWQQAYPSGSPDGRPLDDVETEVLAMMPPPTIFGSKGDQGDDFEDRLAATDTRGGASSRALRQELAGKTDQIRQLQTMVERATPAQKRLEEQLASAQQLVRGSLLQHERYEATTEQQAKEIAHLRREKERVERQLAAARQDTTDAALDGNASSLQELLEVERARFKRAINAATDERERCLEALERERMEHANNIKEARLEANRQVARALAEGANGPASDQQRARLTGEVAHLRAALAAEQEESAATFRDLWDQLQTLRKQAAVTNGEHGSHMNGSSARHADPRLEAELQEAHAAARDMARENDVLHRRLEDVLQGGGGGQRRLAGRSDEQEELEDKLRDSQKALGKMKQENARLQVIAAGRSPVVRGSGW